MLNFEIKSRWRPQQSLLGLLGLLASLAVPAAAQPLPPPPEVPEDVPAIDAPNRSPLPPNLGPTPSTPVAPIAPTATPAPPQPFDSVVQNDPNYEAGQDLRQLVKLFINESLDAGNKSAAVNYNDLYTQLLARSYGNPQPLQAIEYQLVLESLETYGEPSDRLLLPQDFKQLLNRTRPVLQAQTIAPRVIYLRVPELTPSTAEDIEKLLFAQDFSRGLILDLRGSTGYDPQVVADVSRIFLPRTIQPLAVTEDRFGQLTAWDSERLPVAADFPLAVLIDGNTRQGAVLLAANLVRSGTTVTIGQTTQGTERQTRFFLLPSGAAVELAVARWQSGDNRPLINGLTPMQPVSGSDDDWFRVALSTLSLPPQPPQISQRPTVFVQEDIVGRYPLGLDTRNLSTNLLGNVDFIKAETGQNVFQPNSDLKIFYLQDYVLFTYRHPGILDSFFADRIYTTHPEAQTAEGLGINATYSDVVRTYGGPGENGYNEVVPFPQGSREAARDDRYYVNYDAIGIGFIFESGTNQVVGIGLYKPGS